MKIDIKFSKLKPVKEEEITEKDTEMTEVLEYIHSGSLDIEQNRREFRRTPTFISIVLITISLPLAIYFTDPFNPYGYILIFVFFTLSKVSICFYSYWKSMLDSLYSDIHCMRNAFTILLRLVPGREYTITQWKEMFPVLRYRHWVLDCCLVGLHILYYIGLIIVSIYFGYIGIQNNIRFACLMLQVIISLSHLFFCITVFSRTLKNLRRLRETHSRILNSTDLC